jgi:anti-sigma B factor antagonist
MNIVVRRIGNCVVLDCSGKITLGPGTMNIRNAVREAVKGGPKKIVLNLGGVDYIDSSGIGELVSSFTHVQSQGSKLVLLNLTKRIQELLVITKLITVFDIFQDEKSALAGC